MSCVVSLIYQDLVGPSCSRESFACPAKQALLIARHDLVLESDKTCLVPTGSHRGLGESCREWANVERRPDPPPCQRDGQGGDQTYVHVRESEGETMRPPPLG
jgi:hypothetical protein